MLRYRSNVLLCAMFLGATGWISVGVSHGVFLGLTNTALAQQSGDCNMNADYSGSTASIVSAENFRKLNRCIADLQKIIKDAPLNQSPIPEGMVAAFDTDSCPNGWELHLPSVGRFVVGGIPGPSGRAVPLPAGKPPIIARSGSMGGTTITTSFYPFPPQLVVKPSNNNDDVHSLLTVLPAAQLQPNSVALAGEIPTKYGPSLSFYLAPPYLALLLCKKQRQ